jgi:hypothetical protein
MRTGIAPGALDRYGAEMEQLASEPDVRLIVLRPPYRFQSPFDGQAFVLVLHSDDPHVDEEMRRQAAEQIVASGCRYACCAGADCSRWHDAIDLAQTVADLEPRDERLIMTTWHESESLSEVVWFAFNCTAYDHFCPERFLIVLLRPVPSREDEATAAVHENLM